jgi:transposase
VHSLRLIRELAHEGLGPMRPLFAAMASTWPIAPPPDRGLLCVLLMALYGIRSDAAFCAELTRNPLFRWFLDVLPDDAQIDPRALAQIHSGLLRNRAANDFFERIIADAGAAGLLSNPHFSLDLPQIDAWRAGGVRDPSP